MLSIPFSSHSFPFSLIASEPIPPFPISDHSIRSIPIRFHSFPSHPFPSLFRPFYPFHFFSFHFHPFPSHQNQPTPFPIPLQATQPNPINSFPFPVLFHYNHTTLHPALPIPYQYLHPHIPPSSIPIHSTPSQPVPFHAIPPLFSCISTLTPLMCIPTPSIRSYCSPSYSIFPIYYPFFPLLRPYQCSLPSYSILVISASYSIDQSTPLPSCFILSQPMLSQFTPVFHPI